MTATTASAGSPANIPSRGGIDRRAIKLLALLAILVILGGGIWIAWRQFHKGIPRLDASTVELAKFAITSEFDKLPFESQRQYMKVLEKREEDKELEKVWKDKKITDTEYKASMNVAWLAKHLSRVDKYFSFRPGQERIDYLNKLLDKQEKDKTKPKKPGDTSDDEVVHRDKTVAKMRTDTWPPEIRDQWKQFNKILKDQEKAREKALRAAAQTRPTVPKN
jgi:hypothetical protein